MGEGRGLGRGGAHSATRMLLAETRVELLLVVRRGEAVLLTLVFPAGLLLFLATVPLLPAPYRAPGLLFARVLSLAVVSSSLVTLSIATGYERYYGVLKRLGATPLPRWALLLAKSAAVLCLEVVQAVVLYVLARALGWAGGVDWAVLAGAVLLGSLAFAGLGMLSAGRLSAEANLAGVNGLFLVFMLLGDTVFPLESLPRALGLVARVLPSRFLTAALLGSVRSPSPGFVGGAGFSPGPALIALGVWAVAAVVAAAAWFRWE